MPKRKTKTKAKPPKANNAVLPKSTVGATPLDVRLVGRPTKFTPQIAEIAKRCVQQHTMTDEQVCQVIGIGPTTWYVWMNKYPSFREAVARAKEVANQVVEASLLRRATGYSVEAVKIFMPVETTETITARGRKIVRRQRPVRVSYLEHIPGDVNAMTHWQTNRDAGRWHKKAEDVPVPVLPTAEAEERRVAWQKMIQVIKQNAADGNPPLLSLPAPAEEAKDITPTLASASKKTNGKG